MIYFTSDFHFGHMKSFLWEPRGFTNWEEHAQIIINNFKKIVFDSDILYILGDCLLQNEDFGIECLKQIPGFKYLAIGNHDSDRKIERYKKENIFEDIEYGYRMEHKDFTFYAQHYPAMMGNYKDKHPVICLAGHTHAPDKFQNMEFGCYNIALDAHDCKPVSIDTIVSDIKDYRTIHPIAIYPDRSPYCAYCANRDTCIARPGHELPCPGYVKGE